MKIKFGVLLVLLANLLACNNNISTSKKDFKGQEITFFPTSKNNDNVESFQELFFNSDHYNNENIYTEYYNYMPKEKYEEYNIGAYEVYSEKNKESYFFVTYDNLIYRVDSIGASMNASFKGFVHFAITDINKDGFFELTISYHYSNRINVTYIDCFDSKTRKFLHCFSVYGDYIYFKNNESGKLALYKSKNNDIEDAAELYSEFMLNTTKYNFKQKNYNLSSDNYDVEIIIDEDTINFPFVINNTNLEFSVNSVMTYKGETFSYTNSDTCLYGAAVTFVSDSDSVNIEGISCGEAITDFTIETGQVIDSTYKYYDTSKRENDEGTYDMIVSYRGEKILVEDVLVITR